MRIRRTGGLILELACLVLAGAASAGVVAAETGTPKQRAPIDLTGYWVSIITEDWRWRMITPPKGDYESLFPLNDKGRKLADTWDPDRDTANGDQCKAYGAGGIMRMPTRVHVEWEDDYTLRLETDAGKQTRRFYFDPAKIKPTEALSLQGVSTAEWVGIATERFLTQTLTGAITHLKVVTTHLSPGYLRKNGVPYGSKAVLTEYFDIEKGFGSQWFTVTSIIEDPDYLTGPFITSSDFKRLDGNTGWRPEPCKTGWGPIAVDPRLRR